MERGLIFEDLEKFFIEVIEGIDGELFHSRSREGIFSPALTMWLMISQRTQSTHTLLGALEGIRTGSGMQVLSKNTRSKRARGGKASLHTGGFSKARKRVSLETIHSIGAVISEQLITEQEKLWNGMRVLIMDATLITIAHTQKNKEAYPGYRNQHNETHNSQLRCMCFHELYSGVALNPVIGAYRGPKAQSEQKLALEMMGQVPDKALLVGDINFGVFNVVYQAQKEGHEVLMRLNETRAKALYEGAASKRSLDQSLRWTPSVNYRKTYPELPEDAAVEGRVIKKIIKNPGCKPIELYLFTTSQQSVNQLVKLYKERSRIEHDIRSIKYTIGMEMLLSKTPEMLEKEIVLGIAAYNMMRAVIARAAKKISLRPRQISFSAACRLTQIAKQTRV